MFIEDSGLGRAKSDKERISELEQRIAKIEIKVCAPGPNLSPNVTARAKPKNVGRRE